MSSFKEIFFGLSIDNSQDEDCYANLNPFHCYSVQMKDARTKKVDYFFKFCWDNLNSFLAFVFENNDRETDKTFLLDVVYKLLQKLKKHCSFLYLILVNVGRILICWSVSEVWNQIGFCEVELCAYQNKERHWAIMEDRCVLFFSFQMVKKVCSNNITITPWNLPCVHKINWDIWNLVSTKSLMQFIGNFLVTY